MISIPPVDLHRIGAKALRQESPKECDESDQDQELRQNSLKLTREAFKFLNMGPASSMAVIFIALLAIVTFVASRLLRTEVAY